MRYVILSVTLLMVAVPNVFAQQATSGSGSSAASTTTGTQDVNARLNEFASAFLDRAVLGDIIPVQGRPQPVAVKTTPAVHVPPKVVSVAQPTTFGAVTSFSSASGETQNLLASGDPASVIVGARLSQTRIIGSPGSGVRFNTQARGLLAYGFGR